MEMRIQPDLERASGSTNSDRVDFDGPNDIYNPQNWSFAKKSLNTFLYGLTTLGSTWASAAYSPANEIVAHDFQVSNEVAVLGTSVLLLGFGFGPLVWAPLSEVYGRKWPTVAPCFISALFSFATGASKDIQSIIITRFFCGFFGAAPITCTGGVFADIWDSSQRGNAIVGYALAVAAGPVLAPIVGGAIVVCGVSWRWTEYVGVSVTEDGIITNVPKITGIIQLLTVVLDVIFVDESYAPRLLVSKARRLRFETGNWGLHAEYEELNITFSGLLHKFGVRPWQMLFTPICGLIALYASFIYGVFYASLASFPIIFQQDRGWNPLVGSLPFLALLLGILLGSALNVLNQVVFYNRRLASQGDHKAIPEARLPPMMTQNAVRGRKQRSHPREGSLDSSISKGKDAKLTKLIVICGFINSMSVDAKQDTFCLADGTPIQDNITLAQYLEMVKPVVNPAGKIPSVPIFLKMAGLLAIQDTHGFAGSAANGYGGMGASNGRAGGSLVEVDRTIDPSVLAKLEKADLNFTDRSGQELRRDNTGLAVNDMLNESHYAAQDATTMINATKLNEADWDLILRNCNALCGLSIDFKDNRMVRAPHPTFKLWNGLNLEKVKVKIENARPAPLKSQSAPESEVKAVDGSAQDADSKSTAVEKASSPALLLALKAEEVKE
ncbi:unnamed protein product [Alternaria sp. RS040]